MKKKKQTLYSLADWKFHKNKLGYDDLIDENNNLIVTIAVIDIALDEILNASYLEEPIENPRKIFIQDKQCGWNIYLDTKWLTPKNVQEALKEFGKLTDKEFTFEPYKLPKDLKESLDRKAEKWTKEIKEVTPADIKKSNEFMKEMKKEAKLYKKKRVINKISSKRLLEVITHKLKF